MRRALDGVVTRRRLLVGGAAVGATALVRTGDAAQPPRVLTSGASLIELQEDDRNSREAKLARRAKRAAFDDRGVDALVEALAMAGIATYAQAGDGDPMAEVTRPAAPIAFLRSQVATMTAQLSTGSGTRGVDLDDAYAVPDDAPPPSMLLGAYVFGANSVGARISRELMRPQTLDPERPGELVIPTAVQVLMAGELMTVPVVESAVGLARPMRFAAYGAELAAPCSAVKGFVDAVLDAIAEAIKITGKPGGITEVAIDTWNFLVEVFKDAAKAFVNVLAGPILEVLGAIAAIVGIGGMIASLTQPWTVSLTATPETNHFRVEGSGGPAAGVILAMVESALPDWPEEIADCAATVGTPLPPLKPKDGAVVFTRVEGPIELIETGVNPTEFLGGEATFGYATRMESKAVHAKGVERTGLLTLTATFTRDDLEPVLRAIIDGLFSSLLGNGNKGFLKEITGILGGEVAKVTAGLIGVSTVSSQPVTIPITYHEPKPEDPTEEPTSDDDDEGAVGCVVDTWRWDSFFGEVETTSPVTYEISGPPFYMVFKANGLMEQSSDGAVIAFSTVGAAGTVSGTVTIVGKAGGTWKGEPDGPIQVKFGDDGFVYTLDLYLDGASMGASSFTARELQGSLEGSYLALPTGNVTGTANASCDGDTMELQPGQSLGIYLIRGE